MNPVELKQDTLGHILTTLQIAYAQDGLGKVEGEAVGNLGRRLEWKTIHVGTDTTEQVQGVP